MLEASATLNDYFDGSSYNSTWSGTAHASTSSTAGGTTSQWVQVRANSALEATILTRMSAVESRATNLEAANPVVVGSVAARSALFPAPVQGNTVFRTDLGYMERYYTAYDSVANPSGTTGTVGWYEYRGGAPLSENKIINGDFAINQRGYTTSTATGFAADRWFTYPVTGTVTTSRQTLAVGTITGVESDTFIRIVTSGQSGTTAEADLITRIEDVKTLSGKTATISFWAKSGSGTPNVAYTFTQNFGSGGSANVNTGGKLTLSGGTSWTKYSATISIPSISGKTVGAGSFLQLTLWASAGSDYDSRTGTLGIQSNTFDFAAVQLEEGPVATPFKRQNLNYQAELAACQRYYETFQARRLNNEGYAPGTGYGYYRSISWAVPKRIAPTVTLPTTTAKNTSNELSYSDTDGYVYQFASNAAGNFYMLWNAGLIGTASAEL